MRLPRGPSGRQVVAALQRAGWEHVRTRGSHAVLVHPGHEANIPVPPHDRIGRGLLRKIIRDAHLTVTESTELLQA
jgi:predicted RNA binding protein YcfA (HicA-like mRNA interferase family)